MFKCEDCGRQTKPGEKMTRVPIEYRRVVYKNKLGSKVKTSEGVEIVREINVCPTCIDGAEKKLHIIRLRAE